MLILSMMIVFIANIINAFQKQKFNKLKKEKINRINSQVDSIVGYYDRQKSELISNIDILSMLIEVSDIEFQEKMNRTYGIKESLEAYKNDDYFIINIRTQVDNVFHDDIL